MRKTLAEVFELPHTEIVKWRAFYRLHPFGPEVDDFRWARLATIIFASHGVKADITDFMLGEKPEPPKPDWRHSRMMLRGAIKASSRNPR